MPSASDSLANREQGKAIIEKLSTLLGTEERTVAALMRHAYAGKSKQAVCGRVPQCWMCQLRAFCGHYRKRPSIKEMPEAERPRERLLSLGQEALSDAELLGIVLGHGTREQTAVDLAQKLLAAAGSLRGLDELSTSEMRGIPGMGTAKTAQVKAALALARRLKGAPTTGAQFSRSKDVFDNYHERLRDAKQETFMVLLLDAKHKLMREANVSRGSLTASIVHPREAARHAVRESAAAAILVHNHPSGDPTPSEQDIAITHRLFATGELLGIEVLDHIVIGKDAYFSFADKGLLRKPATA